VTRKTRNVVIAALVLACGAGLLIWAAADAQWVQTVSAQEVINSLDAYKSKSLQVFGKVVPASIKEQGHAVEFELYWPKEGQKTLQTLHVKYTGLIKVSLAADTDVLINCRVDEQGQVTANKILTKCPSKYSTRNATDKR
jgi:cytochrome c-type biogenesis protein CcmE